MSCLRCILLQSGEDETYKLILEKIKLLPESKKADDDLYHKRLEICKQCDNLDSGLCLKCGCYVEWRAAVKLSHCPLKKKRW